MPYPRTLCETFLESITALVRSSSEERALRDLRDIEPRNRVTFYLVGALGAPNTAGTMLKVLEAIHSSPDGRGGYEVLGLFVLPDAFELPRHEDSVRWRAQTYASLQVLESITRDTRGTAWEDWFPFDRVWLIDAQDRSGRTLGPFATFADNVGECFTALIAENVLERQVRGVGADEREMRDIFGNAYCYASIGYAQLAFPKETLKGEILSGLRKEVYQEYILRNPELNANKIADEGRKLLTVTLRLGNLDEELNHCYSSKNKQPLPSFSLDWKKDEETTGRGYTTEEFLKALGKAVWSFREGELNDARTALIESADSLSVDLTKRIAELLTEWLDGEERGPIATAALTDEILGEAETEVSEKRCPLSVFIDQYSQRLETQLGLGNVACLEERRSQIEEELARVKRKLRDVAKCLRDLEESAPQAEPADENHREAELADEAAARVMATSEKADLERRVPELESERDSLAEALLSHDRFWQSPDEKGRLLAELDAREEAAARTKIARLTDLDEELKKVQSAIQNIKDRVFREILRVAVGLPASVLGLWGVSIGLWYQFLARAPNVYELAVALGLTGEEARRFASQYGNVSHWKWDVILGTFQRGFPVIVLGIALYIVFAAWQYNKRVWRPLRELRRQEAELRRQLLAHQNVVIQSWREALAHHLDCRVLDHVVLMLRKVEDNVRQLRDTVKAFIRLAQNAAGAGKSSRDVAPSSAWPNSVISAEDVGYFESVCLGGPVSDEIAPVFSRTGGGTPLSELVWIGEGSIKIMEERLKTFLFERFESRLGRVSIEELLMERWQAVHPVVSPEKRARAIFALNPFVQLVDLPGAAGVAQQYAVGIFQGGESRLVGALGETPPWPFVVFPCSSREKVLVFCQTGAFSAAYLARLPDYKSAFEQLSKGKDGTGLYPKAATNRTLPKLIP